MQALGHCAARQGRDVLSISQTDLFKRYAKVPLLIVDDFVHKPLLRHRTRTSTNS